MKTLVVGGGGREHALTWKLAQEGEVVAAPGNAGMASVARCEDVPVTDHQAILQLASREQPDLIVVGPEDPLIAGLADILRESGFAVFGPGRAGAQLEGSKAFSKALMREAGVPTAGFETFTNAEDAHAYVTSRAAARVVKASGAALGKGVIVADSEAEAHEAVEEMLVEVAFGEAGKTIVIEDRLTGPEFSLLTLCSKGSFRSLPVAQDHKRVLDGDRGPNTGGMGSFSPIDTVTFDLISQAENLMVRPILKALESRGIEFRGVLFTGLLIQEGTPYCLEYNVRFGDPEIQSVIRRIGRGFPEALLACAKGAPIPEIEILDNAAVSVCIASGGYPGSYEKGKTITVNPLPQGVEVFHAGTAEKEGHLVTNGGRVFAVSATGKNVADARILAYQGVEAIQFEGAYHRKDIAK